MTDVKDNWLEEIMLKPAKWKYDDWVKAKAAILEEMDRVVAEITGPDIPVSLRGKELGDGDPVDFDLDKDDPMDVMTFVQDNGKNIEKEAIRHRWQEVRERL